MDFGLDLPADPVAAPAPTPLPSRPNTGDPLADLDLMDFDIPAASTPAPVPAPAIDDLSLDHNFDLPELQAAKPTAVDAVAPEFDLSGIDLDLGAKRASPSVREETLSAL